MLLKKYFSLLSICLLLAACGSDSGSQSSSDQRTELPSDNQPPTEPVPTEPTEPQYSGARLELITPVAFKRTLIRDTYYDQIESRFTRDVNLNLLIKNQSDQVIYERTTEQASIEHTFNLVDESQQSILEYGVYQYEITATLKDGSFGKTFQGDFTRQAKPLMEVDNRISDISIYGESVLIAEDTDFGLAPKVHRWTTDSQSEINLTVTPDVVHDMAEHEGQLYFGGQRMMSGELLVKHDPSGESADQALSDLLPCNSTNQDDWSLQCNVVFALASYNDALWVGTDKGLYRLNNDNTFTLIENHGLEVTTDIKSLYVDRDNQLWAMSFVNGGIAMLGESGWQHFTQENSLLPAGGYLGAVQGEDREYWFAGNITGLVKMNLDTAELEVFTPNNSDIIDHNLVSVAYTNEIMVGSHDYGVAKRRANQGWQVSDNKTSEIKTIPTDACQWTPDSSTCKQVIVVERMIQTKGSEPKVFSAIGKGLYQLY